MNAQIEKEKGEQASYWFLYKGGNIFAALFLVMLIGNENYFIGLLGFLLQAIFNFIRVPLLINKFEQRLKVVAFKTQIENIYVFSRFADQNDDTVAEAFYRAVDLLKSSGNVHEVRVHLALFRDVKVFTWFYDQSGKLVKTNVWREAGSSFESWEDYLVFCEKFEKEDRDIRLRQIRKDNAGFDWVNENLFYQWKEGKEGQ